jgi:hypothetical protein
VDTPFRDQNPCPELATTSEARQGWQGAWTLVMPPMFPGQATLPSTHLYMQPVQLWRSFHLVLSAIPSRGALRLFQVSFPSATHISSSAVSYICGCPPNLFHISNPHHGALLKSTFLLSDCLAVAHHEARPRSCQSANVIEVTELVQWRRQQHSLTLCNLVPPGYRTAERIARGNCNFAIPSWPSSRF